MAPLVRRGAASSLRRVLAALVCLSVPVGVAGEQPADDDTLVWFDDYQQALAQAKETGRPLLVEFRCAP